MKLEAYGLREQTSIVGKKKQERFNIADEDKVEEIVEKLKADPMVRSVKVGVPYTAYGLRGAEFRRAKITYNKYF
jgi:hypothetical protein